MTFARRSFRFQSTLPLRGVTVSRFWSWIACRRFQSTLPLRGATRRRRPVPSGLAISIHTPLAGSDLAGHAGIAGTGISIHTPLAGSDSFTPLSLEKEEISIHTPLAGSDCGVEPLWRVAYPISIHTPLAGSDMPPVTAGLNRLFQSTLPLRGATHIDRVSVAANLISIHTPLAGSDAIVAAIVHVLHISIHTPLAGSDMAYQMIRAWIPDFNPHSPCGERPPYRPRCRIKARFQSTLPLRGATRMPP